MLHVCQGCRIDFRVWGKNLDLEELPGQFQFFTRRKRLVIRLCSRFIHQIALWRGIFASDAIQVAVFEFLAQEKGVICAGRKPMVADSVVPGEGKSAHSTAWCSFAVSRRITWFLLFLFITPINHLLAKSVFTSFRNCSSARKRAPTSAMAAAAFIALSKPSSFPAHSRNSTECPGGSEMFETAK